MEVCWSRRRSSVDLNCDDAWLTSIVYQINTHETDSMNAIAVVTSNRKVIAYIFTIKFVMAKTGIHDWINECFGV